MKPNKIVERTKHLNTNNSTLFDIFQIAVETNQESSSNRSYDLKRAYEDDDRDGILIALCGYSMDSLKDFLEHS